MKLLKQIKPRYIIGAILLLTLLFPLVLSFLWLGSYQRFFPAEKFSKAHKEQQLTSPTVFVDRNHRQLGSIGGSRDFHIQKVSAATHDLSVLTEILLAKEDRKIRGYNGIQYRGILGFVEAAVEVISWKGKLRAMVQTFGGNTQGASGLLEQIAGNLYGHDDQNPWFEKGLLSQIERKLVKTLNAIRLAHLYQNAEQVVEDYVNLTYTSGMYHGINAFIMKRFDKDVDQILVPIDLTKPFLKDEQVDIVNMLAYYVGQLTGPANYDPATAKDPIEHYRITKRAEFKKNLVLEQMLSLGMIQKPVFLKAVDRKLPFKEGTIAAISYDPNMELLRRESIEWMKTSAGGEVRTTLIKEVHDLVTYELIKRQTLLSIRATRSYIPSNAPLLRTTQPELYGVYRVKVLKRSNDKVLVELGGKLGNGAVIIPGALDTRSLSHFQTGNYISVGIDGFNDNRLPLLSLIQKDPLIKGAVLLKNLSNGQVIAFGGGGYLTSAVSSGSAFKPFLLKLAFDFGWQLEDRLNNRCTLRYRLFSGPFYSPENYGRCDESSAAFELYPDLKTVLKKSINKPVVYLLSHLTDQLREHELLDVAGSIIKPYDAENLQPLDFAYLIGNRRVDFFQVTDDGGKQFVGQIPFAGQRNKMIFEILKKEKYLALNESNRFLRAAQVLDQDYEDFMRWHTVVEGAREKYNLLRKGVEAYQQGVYQGLEGETSEVALLKHFFYDDQGDLRYDPYSQDKIAFVNWELAKDFLARQKLSGVYLDQFTIDEHERYDNWVEDYSRISDQEFFAETIQHHPQFRGLLNIELFKRYISDLTGVDRKAILGNYSLPLGTHRVSLVKLSSMYSQILTFKAAQMGDRNDQTFFIHPSQKGVRYNDDVSGFAEFELDDQSDIYKALYAARQEQGGTSYHLKSPLIIAGKTGTDPKYKTYVAIMNINGYPYVATAFFGVDLNKHEPLVKSWTGGHTAAVYLDRVALEIQKRFLPLFPRKHDPSIPFDPDFEYDSTADSTAGTGSEEQVSTEAVEKEPDVIWNADGTYRLVHGDESTAEEQLEAPTVNLDYSEEEIKQILDNLETE